MTSKSPDVQHKLKDIEDEVKETEVGIPIFYALYPHEKILHYSFITALLIRFMQHLFAYKSRRFWDHYLNLFINISMLGSTKTRRCRCR